MEKRLKVLFVASGNSKNFEIAPFIKEQGNSLVNAGIEVKYFPIMGKGIIGYFKNIFLLKKFLKENPVDILHSHYTLSGWVSVLACSNRPVILSLMGSDAYGSYIGPNKIKFSSRYLTFLTYLIQPFVDSIICKSKNIQDFVYIKRKSNVIPNGINLEKFRYFKQNFKNELQLDTSKKHILFLGDINDQRKNFKLVKEAVKLLNFENIVVLTPFPIAQKDVIKYLNSVDVLIVTSYIEGSPNVIKEAMACNCPIVATDVGDIRWVIGDTEGCYITSFVPADVAEKIKMALEFSEKVGRTKGRERIIKLGLDSETIAKRIISVYQRVLQKKD